MTYTSKSQNKTTKYTLPQGWRWARLEEVCHIIMGQSPPGNTYRKTPDGLPFFQGKADFGLRHPVARVWCIAPSRIAKPGDILLSVRAPVGPTNVADVECCIGRGLAAIQPKEQADKEFILLALKYREDVLVELGSGSTFEAIRKDDLFNLEIPLPPLDEQRRIAKRLNEQMAAVESARRAAEEQLQAARRLPSAYLREVFTGKASKKWKIEKLGNLSTQITDGPHVTPRYQLSGIPFITVRNIVNRRIDLSNVSYITPEDHAEFCKRVKAEKGDILYTKDGTLGIPCVVDTNLEFSFFVSVALIKLMRDKLNPFFVAFALESPQVLAQVEELGAGMGLKHMVIKSIKALEIPVPGLAEQEKVANEIKAKLGETKTIVDTLESQLAEINRLPASLLREAFAGNL